MGLGSWGVGGIFRHQVWGGGASGIGCRPKASRTRRTPPTPDDASRMQYRHKQYIYIPTTPFIAMKYWQYLVRAKAPPCPRTVDGPHRQMWPHIGLLRTPVALLCIMIGSVFYS